jgi:hypothetical protein
MLAQLKKVGQGRRVRRTIRLQPAQARKSPSARPGALFQRRPSSEARLVRL